MRMPIVRFAGFLALMLALVPGIAQGSEKSFIGSAACGECHEEQFENYHTYSKKAHSWQSVKIMLSDLKPDEAERCFDCHTTGHGKPGGFVSFAATPHMADVGCETCHGPGSLHAEEGDTQFIQRTPTIDQCQACHSKERVGDFNFKPLLFSGAH